MIMDGQIKVSIEEQDIQSELRFWENSFIIYVLEGELTMTTMRKFMIHDWNFVTLLELYYNEEGYFIIWLKSKTNKEVILMRGPYTIYQTPIFLQYWNPYFVFKEDVICVIPIWVIFYQLTLMY